MALYSAGSKTVQEAHASSGVEVLQIHDDTATTYLRVHITQSPDGQ